MSVSRRADQRSVDGVERNRPRNSGCTSLGRSGGRMAPNTAPSPASARHPKSTVCQTETAHERSTLSPSSRALFRVRMIAVHNGTATGRLDAGAAASRLAIFSILSGKLRRDGKSGVGFRSIAGLPSVAGKELCTP